MRQPLQVGIIGASAERGWARDSHVPAVQRLDGLMLAAVVAGSRAKSDAAAKAFGARTAYADSTALIKDPSIDIVSVCVKVPDHRDLVLHALAAGKHVYCEWPLGRTLTETQEFTAAARSAGVHVAIGLQTRMNPTLRKARSLLQEGAIGRILNARIVSSTIAFGSKVEEAMAFAEDPTNGATLVAIQGAHTIDAAIAILGILQSATALMSTQYPRVDIGDPPILRDRLTPDHLLVQVQLASSGVVAIEVAGGVAEKEVTFSFEITGSNGQLQLRGGAIRGFQSGTLKLILNGKPQAVDEGELGAMPEMALNVAGVYAAFRDDIKNGTHTVPDFDHATHLTKLMTDLSISSSEGCRKAAAGWPVQ